MRNFVRSAALLLAGAVLGAGLTSLTAQTSKVSQVPPPGSSVVSVAAESGQLVSGPDLALRIDERIDGRVTGTLMVKSGETWLEVRLASQNTTLKLP